MSELQPTPEEHLHEPIAAILDESRSRVARSTNTAMVHAYWHIGREIVEVEQHGAERAGYGEGLMKRVAERLSARFGKGFSLASLEAKTIGIVLCSDKNDAMVRITLPDENEQVLAARCQMYLPTEDELRAELEREEAERVLRLTAPDESSESSES